MPTKAELTDARTHAARRVAEFHDAFEVKAGTYAEVAVRRITLHDEEHRELCSEREGALRWLGAQPGNPEAREAVARELADVMVVAYGTADLLDIDLDAAFDAVMDANMAKLPDCEGCGNEGGCSRCDYTGKDKPIKRPDGKALRPEGWQPPDLSGALQ